MGARLIKPNGKGFWLDWDDGRLDQSMAELWLRIIRAGGDEPTEESRRVRRRLMTKAKMHDPRDGSVDAEPL